MNSGTRQICTQIHKREIERDREREDQKEKITVATIIENNTTKATNDVFAYKLTNTNYVILSLFYLFLPSYKFIFGGILYNPGSILVGILCTVIFCVLLYYVGQSSYCCLP